MTAPASASGLDLSQGVPVDRFAAESRVEGKLGDDEILLVRLDDEYFAVGAKCTHYGGPLAQGLIVGDEVRCPLHHACFSLRTGEPLRPPAFDAIPRWRVERVGDRVFVREKLAANNANTTARPVSRTAPSSVVIVGGGAAGLAAAATLRREGYRGSLALISADESSPYDRPNLSKDYLAGEAGDAWIPLRSPEYYKEHAIDLVLQARVTKLDTSRRRVELEDGRRYEFDRLLLATGADPIKLDLPGSASSIIRYLRTYADSRALIALAVPAKGVVVLGGSFIGLEVAASLRTRGVDVDVVALQKQPLDHVFGPELGRFVRGLHEAKGVTFHMEDTVVSLDGRKITLRSGKVLDADFLVLGVGVRPSVALAEQAGLKTDRGVSVDEYLETSVPGIFAAGDIARWPDAHSGERIRVEHWVVAERQGQTAAWNVLGQRKPFDAVPFFWTSQYGVAIKYVGHAEKWDDVRIDGRIEDENCSVTYSRAGIALAVATISRDLRSLEAELEFESRA
jgi:NADPH-dependent 2,4-dienoyl-CoA reductase/sulfur reductase-like enzyme/nitrite reductase/ring-hydroxylating ferredoxin subunit